MEELIGLEYSPAATIIFIVTIGISLMALYGRNNLIDRMLLHPPSFFGKKQYYTIITSGFIHGDMMHLMFNMLSFYFFAFYLEFTLRGGIEYQDAFGSLQFLIIYFASMIIADIPSLIKNRNNYGYRSLGASGAISAVIFSFILFHPEVKMGLFILPPIIPAPVFAVLYLLYCHYAAKHANDNINHDAHMYGALSGVALTIIMKPDVVQNFIDKIF